MSNKHLHKLAALSLTVGLALALVLGLWSFTAYPTEAADYTVDTVVDENDGSCSDGDCSLRDAIILANNSSGSDTINFNITGCGTVCTIQPTSPLPTLSGGGITIDGYTQTGALQATDTTSATLKIEIDGTSAGSSNGLYITSADNVIKGLVINRFSGDGVSIGGSGATGNTICGNYIGTDANGTAELGNTGHGVSIFNDAQNNTIGGDAAGERNVISGNGQTGVTLVGDSNTVSGNYIGTDANGTADLSNGWDGVYIADTQNIIGGDTPGERNIISGNDQNGIRITGSGTTSNTVSGNYIGTDVNGTADLGNGYDGIYIEGGAQNNTVGGDTPGEGNVISGNDGNGVYIAQSGATSNTVSGNYIGTDASGTLDRGNTQNGVFIEWGAQNNTIGGDTADEQNVISGNGGDGVRISRSDTTGNTVSGNYIGTDASGTADLGNTGHGVSIFDGARNNTIGGDTPGEQNVISGNDQSGIRIYGSGTTSNTVSGNYIGTDVNGTADLGNGYHGIRIEGGAQNNTVGGGASGDRNVISGNGGAGVMIVSDNNTVSGNYIGTDASGTIELGNDWSGVEITGAQNNTIGGDTPGERNVISGNDRDGISLYSSGTMSNTICGNYIGTDANGTADMGNTWSGVTMSSGAQNNTVGPANLIAHNDGDGVEVDGSITIGNTITQNSIFSNTMGIDLVSGANGNIAAPVIVTTTVSSINVVGTACPGCTVEVFENSDTDDEGEAYVGKATATASGAFTVTFSSLSVPYLTATATDAVSGTSEFSAVFTATVPLTPPVSPTYLPIVLRND